MKKIWLLVTPLLIAAAMGVNRYPKPASPAVVVKFDDLSAKERFLSQNQLGGDDLTPLPGIEETYAVEEAGKALESTPGATVEPERVYRALLVPNDPIYPQWYTDKISAPQAWDVSTGTSGVTIAVIDTGFALDHQDLAGRWATNTAETGGGKETNGVDDDGNGYVDDWRGWDFAQSDNTPNVGSVDTNGDYVTHGTIVAGLVGATGNNSLGVASVNWQAKILPIQALGDDGVGYTSDIASGIRYAVDRGAKVISLSLGSADPDDVMRSQISYAISRGVTVVAAAGNSGTATCGCMVYPANYPEVIAVGATDSGDNKASFSSYGPNLDLVAPGSGSIRTTYWSSSNQTGAYTNSASGTSISTPIVSGTIGSMLAVNPALMPDQIIALINSSTDKTSGMGANDFTDKYGHGRLNAYKALSDTAYRASSGSIPVYRMANWITKERLFTMNAGERDFINGRDGWVYEGVGFSVSP